MEGHAAKNIVVLHRGVSRNNAVEFGQYDQAVGRQQGASKRRVGATSGTNYFAVVINFLPNRRLRPSAPAPPVVGMRLPTWPDICTPHSYIRMPNGHVLVTFQRGRDLRMQRLATVVTDQPTVRVHHTEYVMPASSMLFANDHDAGRTFIVIRRPYDPDAGSASITARKSLPLCSMSPAQAKR